MKTHYQILILMLFATSTVFAQSKLGLGIKAGLNIANQKGTDLDYEIDLNSLT
jgi:hypothetical protein